MTTKNFIEQGKKATKLTDVTRNREKKAKKKPSGFPEKKDVLQIMGFTLFLIYH